MRKIRNLIDVSQKFLVVCDNADCDFKIPNVYENQDESNVELGYYINVPCPECGHVLLTESDYSTAITFNKIINWLNRYFSWITVFYSDQHENEVVVKVKDGVSVTQVKKD